MKAAIIIGIFQMMLYCTNAQGNLQYNKTVLIQADTTFTCIGNACPYSFLQRTIVVPVGKTLKIESLNIDPLAIGNYMVYFNNQRFYSNAGYPFPYVFPIWLPAGTYVIKYYKPSNWTLSDLTDQYFGYTLSALEFNIVQ